MALTYREQVATKCKHFKGIANNTHCAAGVAYDDFKGQGIPCFERENLKCTAVCEKREFPTEEEIDEMQRKSAEYTVKIGKARAAIVAAIGPDRKKQSMGGTIDCPVCEQTATLGFRYAGSYNGHIHASCSTEGCVRWME